MKIMESSINLGSRRVYQEENWKTVQRKIKWDVAIKTNVSGANDSVAKKDFKTLVKQMQAEPAVFNTQFSPVDKIALMKKEMAFLHDVFKSMFSDDPGTRSFLFSSMSFSGSGRGFSFAKNMESSMELSYTIKETETFSHYERETTLFKSDGIIKTSAGKEIRFDLGLNMDREFSSQKAVYTEEEGVVKLIDPLIINFDGNPPELSDMKFSFDLNIDGTEDQISRLMPGSGFLVFDRNGDGLINNGGEMFGAETGDGFAELGEFDLDGNDWIDENDPVFKNLSVWNMGEDDNLLKLGEAGVGAIYLNSAETPFDITGRDNILNGHIDKTGIFLEESGKVGSIQQVKFAV